MPKISERQELLKDIDQTMKLSRMDDFIRDPDNDDDLLETPYGLACTLHVVVSEQRFLNPKMQIDKSKDYIYNYFLNQCDDEFRKITRVSREVFNYLLSRIQGDEVFQNQSINKQAPLHWQLACALDRLGNDGQGVSHARSKLIWGIAQGTVHLYTRRVIQALCNLHEEFICWPSAVERQQISRRLALKGFRDAVGFVDGTTLPLHKKLAMQGNVFMDRKKCYSINAQIMCDDKYCIRYFKIGQPGSWGDSRVFNSTRLAKTLERAFSLGQYLLADRAHGATLYVVPTYKENQRDCKTNSSEPRKIERFNTYLAKARIVNEHTIGLAKARWTSLKRMRIDINEKEHINNVIHQAVACIVLHNITLTRDPWEDEESDRSQIDGPGNRRR